MSENNTGQFAMSSIAMSSIDVMPFVREACTLLQNANSAQDLLLAMRAVTDVVLLGCMPQDDGPSELQGPSSLRPPPLSGLHALGGAATELPNPSEQRASTALERIKLFAGILLQPVPSLNDGVASKMLKDAIYSNFYWQGLPYVSDALLAGACN